MTLRMQQWDGGPRYWGSKIGTGWAWGFLAHVDVVAVHLDIESRPAAVPPVSVHTASPARAFPQHSRLLAGPFPGQRDRLQVCPGVPLGPAALSAAQQALSLTSGAGQAALFCFFLPAASS